MELKLKGIVKNIKEIGFGAVPELMNVLKKIDYEIEIHDDYLQKIGILKFTEFTEYFEEGYKGIKIEKEVKRKFNTGDKVEITLVLGVL